MNNLSIREAFRGRYEAEPRLFRAPGRVNLIGEHTDYNDGFVLPIALEQGTTVAGASRADRKVRIHSLNLNRGAEFDLDHPGPTQRSLWIDYVEGTAQALETRGIALRGADLLVSSDVSIGGGLSSSAALEIAVGTALTALAGVEVDRITLALAGQQAEHTYVGAKTGIMDQFIATLGKRGHALLIDCRALKGTLVPLHLSDYALAVCDTKVKHSLGSSEYNLRRAECEQGVSILREALPGIRALRDVSPEQFREHEAMLPEPVRRRCRHVVYEIDRTLAAARALEGRDVSTMGRLMQASHDSLRDDYQVSCRELDILVDSALSVPGVAGARMTGGGFGGCTVNLLRRDVFPEFRQTVTRRYSAETGVTPEVFIAEASDGAAEITASQPATERGR